MFMNSFNREMVKTIKARYPEGTRVECDYMEDFRAVPSGTRGTVRHVDDMGTVHVSWDNGQGLGLIVGEDSFHIVKEDIENE